MTAMTKAEIVDGLRKAIPFSHAHREVLEAAIAALSAEENMAELYAM